MKYIKSILSTLISVSIIAGTFSACSDGSENSVAGTAPLPDGQETSDTLINENTTAETKAIPADTCIDTIPAETYPSVAESAETSPEDSSQTVKDAAEPVKTVYSANELTENDAYKAALLKEIAKEKDNFVISPLSIKLALNMAALGAGSETEQELLTLFGYKQSDTMINESSMLISELDRPDGSITVNNSVWMSDKNDVKISSEYIESLSDIFKAELFEKDLSGTDIVNDFNGWVNENTNGLIPRMISQPFDESARLLLVNTLYFNNKWQNQFDPDNTGDIIFYGTKGESMTLGMHMKRDDILYSEGDILKSVCLPYTDNSRMKVYLPSDESENITDIIAGLSPAELSAVLEMDYSPKNVDLLLPKFECDYSESLRDSLMLLGISTAFDPDSADFSGMLDGDSEYPVYISDVIHASKIKCGEIGTEAAAATAVIAAAGAALPPEDQIYFTANRPFLYVIESSSGEALFMGIISNF